MRRFVVSALTVLLTVTPLVTSSAKAASLWWIKVITTQKTFAGCKREAESAARSLSNVRVTPDEISGFSIDEQVYVAITCVERGADQRAVAVIAGVGDDINWVRQVVQNTAELVRTSGEVNPQIRTED
jgi:hypothetical protein